MDVRWNARLPFLRRRPRVYLHLGAMKSGTTYLQSLMEANREPLARAGFAFAGRVWGDQSRAVRDILFTSDDPRVTALTDGMWEKLAGEMTSYPGEASILSMEFLSYADPATAARVVQSLEGADVHAVLTVRDAAGAIPAQWQTSCRNGGKLPYRRYLRGVRSVVRGDGESGGKGARLFQRTQGIPRMLETWVPLVGRRRFHVVTVPPRGSDPWLLWQRFAAAIGGLDPATCEHPPLPKNPSLGHPSTELLRLLNVELGRLPLLDYRSFVKGALARDILSTRIAEERPVGLHRGGLALASRWNRQVSSAIVDSGVRLSGTLDDLPQHRPGPDTPAQLPTPTQGELLAAAATARDGLHAVVSGLETIASAGHEAGELPAERTDGWPAQAARNPAFFAGDWRGRTDPDRWRDAADPVAAAVSELAHQLRRGLELQPDPR